MRSGIPGTMPRRAVVTALGMLLVKCSGKMADPVTSWKMNSEPRMPHTTLRYDVAMAGAALAERSPRVSVICTQRLAFQIGDQAC